MDQEGDISQASRFLRWIFASIFIALTALTLYYFYLQQQLTVEESKAALYGNLVTPGTETFNKITAASSDDPLDSEAQAIAQTALFWSGKAGQVEAVRAAKKEYLALAGKNDPSRAAVVNRLISFANYGSAEAQRELFKGEPFEQYLVPSPVETMKNVAEHSLSIYRTSFALQQVGMWHAARLIRHYDAMPTLSLSEAKNHQNEIRRILGEAAELYRTEETMVQDKAIHDVFVQQYFFNQGYLYGILALFDPAYGDEMKAHYENVHAIADRAVKQDGSRIVLLDTRVPFAELNAALFAQALGGEYAAYATARLQVLADFVRKSPSTHTSFFNPFMEWAATASDIMGYWPTHSRIRELAPLNSDFANLLLERGWKL